MARRRRAAVSLHHGQPHLHPNSPPPSAPGARRLPCGGAQHGSGGGRSANGSSSEDDSASELDPRSARARKGRGGGKKANSGRRAPKASVRSLARPPACLPACLVGWLGVQAASLMLAHERLYLCAPQAPLPRVEPWTRAARMLPVVLRLLHAAHTTVGATFRRQPARPLVKQTALPFPACARPHVCGPQPATVRAVGRPLQRAASPHECGAVRKRQPHGG